MLDFDCAVIGQAKLHVEFVASLPLRLTRAPSGLC